MKHPTTRELTELYHHVENEGFGYYMLHYGPDLDLLERMGYNRKKVQEAITLFKQIENDIYEYDRYDEVE